MFVLAHLSDPHLAPLPKPRWPELIGKRATGYVNWQRKRRLIHRADVLARIVADLKAQAPDHIAVTGDLVNIALRGRIRAGARLSWKRSGPPHDVTLVPGNHDAYVRSTARSPRQHWGDYMCGDDPRAEFPFLRRRGPLALIGLSTAVPTPPFMATGRLGAGQIARLAHAARRLRRALPRGADASSTREQAGPAFQAAHRRRRRSARRWHGMAPNSSFTATITNVR